MDEMQKGINKKVKVFTDGGARGNPGPAALGVAFVDGAGRIIKEVSEYLGEQTNNYAEYMALLRALEVAKRLKITNLDCYLDSELVVKQMSGEYRVKNVELRKIFEKVKKLALDFEWIRFSHVLRAKNKEADRLVNEALDNTLSR